MKSPIPSKNSDGPVVVLGAAGAVGRALSRELVKGSGLRLRLVDIDVTALREFAGDDVEVVEVDMFLPGKAAEVLRGSSLLVNCLSLVFFDKVFAMAVDFGVNYTDLISEPSPLQAAEAEARGIVAIPGLGISPGLTNVLVAHASKEIHIEEAEILFALFRSMAPSRGALDTTLWEGGEYSPERNYFCDGNLVAAGPYDGARVVDFGGSMGKQEVYYRPHPEPKSLPKNFPSIRFAAVRGTWQQETMDDLRVLNKYGFLTKENLPTTTAIIWDRLGGIDDPSLHSRSAGMVVVRGTSKTGEQVVRTYRYSKAITGENSYAMTGICASVGVRLIAEHGRTKTGVVDPEAYFDPDVFISELHERGFISVAWTDAPWDGVSEHPQTV